MNARVPTVTVVDPPVNAPDRETSAAPVSRVLLSLGAGFLVALSLPPWGWWPLAIVGIALFQVAADGATRRLHHVAIGAAFAFAWLAMGVGWMWQLTAPGYVVASALYAVWHGAAALVVARSRWQVLARPAAHTLVEALRCSFPFGGAPLATLGISQVAGPLGGLARVGGVILITWVAFQVGVAVTVVARSIGRPTDRIAAGALLAALVVTMLSFVAPRGTGTGRFLDVAAVQGGGEQGTRAIDVPTRVVTGRHLEATATIAPSAELDLVLWPENVIDTADFAASEQLAAVAAEAARLDVPFAVGVTEDVPGQPGRVTNAQVVVTPTGEVTSRYDKVRRVPFGEYVPMRGLLEALGAPVDQVPTNAIAGTTPAVLDLPDGTRLGVVISWEVFFGGRAGEGVDYGAEVIVNPTNGASYTGTIVQTQQVASSRLRAIETGRWVVQAAPTGFSAFVSPGGQVLDRTSVGEQEVIRREIELRDGRTWYAHIGDAPIIVAAALALAAAAASTFAGRRTTNADGSSSARSRWVPARQSGAE